ncbi:unnamed protein product [Symbiodinium pilosum]|uniref:Uncharacterized protein n=1 Tax=Symbiodinium pilosum TaxID=2952 RepID=A0A812SLL4_SYMPI|nr:unnamed protein product [Symbiodinium pilosum]
MQPHSEHTQLLLQHAVYRGDDPFKNLNSVWLGGGDKGELKEACQSLPACFLQSTYISGRFR